MKKIAAFFLICSMLFFAGCWDAREMNELGLVVAVGIDKAQSPNQYKLTVQLANAKLTTQSGGSAQSISEPVYVITAEGKTLFDATRELTKISSKRIMWAHNYIVIIGESVARDGILPVIDYFTHNPELRMKTAVVVSEGDAMEYLGLKSGMEDIPGTSLSSIYGYGFLTAEYIETDMLSLSQSYYSQYSQPLISKISFRKSKLPSGNEVSSQLTDQIEFGGAAVFIKDKMAGWLTPDETKGIAWILNETSDTLVTVAEPSEPDKSVSVEIKSSSVSIETKIENGKPFVTIKISGSGNIVEEDGRSDLSINEYKKRIEGLVDENIVNNVKMSLDKIQKVYKSDVLNLAGIIHAHHNKEWENSIKKNWKDIYPQLPVTVKADIMILGSALYQLPEQKIKKD